jgi:hypothetical protein
MKKINVLGKDGEAGELCENKNTVLKFRGLGEICNVQNYINRKTHN